METQEQAALIVQTSFEVKLIEEVRGRPHLYLKDDKNYKDKTVKMNGWISVATALGLNVDLNPESVKKCQDDWKKICGQYTAYLRKSKPPTGTGARNWMSPSFRHSATMEWYRPYYKPHQARIVSNFGVATPSPQSAAGSTDNDVESVDGESDIFDEDEVNDYVAISNTMERQQQAQNTRKHELSKRKTRFNWEEEFLDTYKSKVAKETKEEDEHYRFGLVVADRLRKIASGGGDTLDYQLQILQLFKTD